MGGQAGSGTPKGASLLVGFGMDVRGHGKVLLFVSHFIRYQRSLQAALVATCTSKLGIDLVAITLDWNRRLCILLLLVSALLGRLVAVLLGLRDKRSAAHPVERDKERRIDLGLLGGLQEFSFDQAVVCLLIIG
mmetsp:Transcript_5445/g.8442  ORF Transcript_5445/g.8442 Transcript_5445/m.8442 type:complete len:134 (-) Transcript_5445:1506-1907(-)